MADRDDWPGDPDESWFLDAWESASDDDPTPWVDAEDDLLDAFCDPLDKDGSGAPPSYTIPAAQADPSSTPPTDPWLFHVTTAENILAAITAGGLVARSLLEDQKEALTPVAETASGTAFGDSADQTLVAKRRRWRVGCYPYQSLADCVPFYFRRATPLLGTMLPDRPGYGPTPRHKPPVAVLALRVSHLRAPWVVIDRHFASSAATCAPGPEGLALVDWRAIGGSHAQKAVNPDAWHRQQAELLVYGDVLVDQWQTVAVDPASALEVGRALGDQHVSLRVADFRSWFT